MPKVFREWNVYRHSPIKKLTENLWTVTQILPKSPVMRRMTMIRSEQGEIFLHSPIALEEKAMEEIEAWGEIRFLVIPSGWHRLDSRIYKDRFPSATLICPLGSKKKVEEVVPVDQTYDQVDPNDSIQFLHIAGIENFEGVIVVKTEKGIALIFNDMVMNLAHRLGISGLILRLIGSSGGPKVTNLMKWFVVKNKEETRQWFLTLEAEERHLYCIIPGHGKIIEEQPNQVLKTIATNL